MVKLSDMSREELIEVIAIKDRIIKDLKNEVQDYQKLIREIQKKQAR